MSAGPNFSQVAGESGWGWGVLHCPVELSAMIVKFCTRAVHYGDHSTRVWLWSTGNVLVQLRNSIFNLIEFKLKVNSPRWLMTALLDSQIEGRRKGWGKH